MTFDTWIIHMQAHGLTRPSQGGSRELWKALHKEHLERKCPECIARRKTYRANQRRQDRDEAMKILGLVKVKGALGGTYWE